MFKTSRRGFLALFGAAAASTMLPNLSFGKSLEIVNKPIGIATSFYVDSMVQGLDVKASVKMVYDRKKITANDIMKDVKVGDRVLSINGINQDAIWTYNGHYWYIDEKDIVEDGTFTFDENTNNGWVFDGSKFYKFSSATSILPAGDGLFITRETCC